MSTDLQSPGPVPPPAPEPSGEPAPAHLLDNAAWAALSGPHRRFAEVVGSAARYQTDVSPFVALADPADSRAWDDLAVLAGPGAETSVSGATRVPDGWETVRRGTGVQLIADTLRSAADPEAVRLTPADVPEMLDLVSRTRPGPFLPRTIELGAYWGIRRGGRLVAMAGERLRPPGYTEISAVCTDAGHRGEGLATRLVRHVAQGIRDRGDTPFLHAAGTNENAIRLYLSMGFILRRRTLSTLVRVPVPEGR
ncbi:acetyltransferase [Streptomyces sp. 150FB]|uniref:GNAT family N-acetyltransferase n=1 Tax=Streptomyces sp. 150FB TaxID=1576605 RepID=UPI000588F9C0|nr:GNAT family N-acetyltransferase [Streptomyces sp. 150FB]KIF77850.1 acetyltransferase [Streptomyces sp. 150FB]